MAKSNQAKNLCYRVEVTSEIIERVSTDLVSAMIRQNDQISQRMQLPGKLGTAASDRWVRRICIGGSVVMAALSALLLMWSLATGRPWHQFLISLLGFILLATLIARLWTDSLFQKFFQWTDSRLEEAASRALCPMKEAAPFFIEYEMEKNTIKTRWYKESDTNTGSPQERVLREGSVTIKEGQLALFGLHSVMIFSRRSAQTPSGLLLFDDPEKWRELRIRIEEAGMDLKEIPRDSPRSSRAFRRAHGLEE